MACIPRTFQRPLCLIPASGFHNFQFPSKLHLNFTKKKFKQLKWRSLNADDDNDGYLVDAPVMVGDGFSFGGGKYSDMPTKADEWFEQGKMIKAYVIDGGITKAKEPIFGLTMGQSSQVEDNAFRWFYVEAGDTSNPSVVLIHGLPSQAYSFRKVIPVLSQDYHVIAFDWLGFGFSDKPQPKYGFDYTMKEYKVSLESLLQVLGIKNVTLVSQGYFAPIVVDYARAHQENLKKLILINPPLTEKHAKLPSTLLSFSNFLLGEIFAQDPLRASDKLLTSCGPYLMDEEDAMVYRRPYLTSGSSGFALTAISRVMKKGIKDSIKEMRSILSSQEWKVPTTIIWGMRDRWLNYDDVEEFAKSAKHELIQLPKALGMGTKEILECFKKYKPVKAKYAYGPKGHCGISLLIFEDSTLGNLEAEHLHKDFRKEGRGRDKWDGLGTLNHQVGKRILYGYIATREDIENFNKYSTKAKVKYDMVPYQSKVIEPVKKMKEESQKVGWLETKIIEDQESTKRLEESINNMAEKLQVQREDMKILMQKIVEQDEECKKGLDYLENIYKQEIDRLKGDARGGIRIKKMQSINNVTAKTISI